MLAFAVVTGGDARHAMDVRSTNLPCMDQQLKVVPSENVKFKQLIINRNTQNKLGFTGFCAPIP